MLPIILTILMAKMAIQKLRQYLIKPFQISHHLVILIAFKINRLAQTLPYKMLMETQLQVQMAIMELPILRTSYIISIWLHLNSCTSNRLNNKWCFKSNNSNKICKLMEFHWKVKANQHKDTPLHLLNLANRYKDKEESHKPKAEIGQVLQREIPEMVSIIR